MHRHTARGNRLGLILVGVVLLAVGAALVLAYTDVIPGASGQVVYPPTLRSFVHDQRAWLWPVAGAVCIVLGLVFLRWLLVQPRADRTARFVVDREERSGGQAGADDAGRTSMPAGAAESAVADNVGALRGVRRVRANLAGSPDAPSLWVTVLTDADADVGRIRREVSRQVVPDARASLEQPEMPAYVTLTVGRRAAKRRDLD